jgi:hypothetical protein
MHALQGRCQLAAVHAHSREAEEALVELFVRWLPLAMAQQVF